MSLYKLDYGVNHKIYNILLLLTKIKNYFPEGKRVIHIFYLVIKCFSNKCQNLLKQGPLLNAEVIIKRFSKNSKVFKK